MCCVSNATFFLWLSNIPCEELTHWKRLDAGRDWGQEEKGTTSLTQCTWVWVNSRSWWWTGRPGMLRFMESQRVGHDWATELNWTELKLFSRLQSSLYHFVVSLLPALKSVSSIFICIKKEYTWGFAGGEVWARMKGGYYTKICFSYLFLNITMQYFFSRNFRETN